MRPRRNRAWASRPGRTHGGEADSTPAGISIAFEFHQRPNSQTAQPLCSERAKARGHLLCMDVVIRVTLDLRCELRYEDVVGEFCQCSSDVLNDSCER